MFNKPRFWTEMLEEEEEWSVINPLTQSLLSKPLSNISLYKLNVFNCSCHFHQNHKKYTLGIYGTQESIMTNYVFCLCFLSHHDTLVFYLGLLWRLLHSSYILSRLFEVDCDS